MEINITFAIKDSNGNEAFLNEEEAKEVYYNLAKYFEEEDDYILGIDQSVLDLDIIDQDSGQPVIESI